MIQNLKGLELTDTINKSLKSNESVEEIDNDGK